MDTPKKKPTGFDLLNPVLMTNAFIRIAWKTAAAVIALAIRVPTSIVLAIVRRVQRARIVRW